MKYIKKYSVIICAAVCMLVISGCSAKYESTYKYPEENFVEADEGSFMVEGRAAQLCVPEADIDLNTEDVNAEAFGLFDVEGREVLSQHNIYEKVYPASTTKILTCLIALEAGNLDDMVKVPNESEITVSGSSMAGLKPGDELPLRDLLYGLMVPSGNDAAVAIAKYISGDTDKFAELMNQRARELGALNSHFVNPHGLPDDAHFTTIYDMYLIFNEAIRHDEFVKIASTPSYSCTVVNPADEVPERKVEWSSGNGFINGKFSFAENMEVLCGKTGHTNAAGFCLVLGETGADNKRYISIIMKSPIYEQMYASMRNLAAKSKM